MASDQQSCKGEAGGGALGGFYGLAFIGAAVYYIQNATSFFNGVVGFFKAMVWPAFLIYNFMDFLNM